MIQQSTKRTLMIVALMGCGLTILAGCGQKPQPLPGPAPTSSQILANEQTALNNPNLSPAAKASIRMQLQKAQSKTSP